MMYRVKEEYRNYEMECNEKACAVGLDVDKPVEVLSYCDDDGGGSHRISYYHKTIGGKISGYMDIDMLEEWK